MGRITRLSLVLMLALACFAVPASAMRNSSVTSAANSTAVVTLTGITGYQVRVYRIDCYTSASTSSLTITDGGTTVYALPSTWCTTTPQAISWAKSLDGAPGNTVVITAGSAGGGNTVTINVEADIF